MDNENNNNLIISTHNEPINPNLPIKNQEENALSFKLKYYKKTLVLVESVGWIINLLILIFGFINIGVLPSLILFIILSCLLIIFPTYLLYLKKSTNETINKYPNYKKIKNENKKHNLVTNGLTSFNKYENEINDLNETFNHKKKISYELIEKRFEPPQMTYDLFISTVDKCAKSFDKQIEALNNIINYDGEFDEKIEDEKKDRINSLKSIIKSIDELNNELILSINDNTEKEDEIENILDDMKSLTDSIEKYH